MDIISFTIFSQLVEMTSFDFWVTTNHFYTGVELGFFIGGRGGPNCGTNILFKSQDKPSHPCINTYTYINLNILILE